MFLKKKHGGCTIGDAEWPEDGAVAEVPDQVGEDLLALAPGEYEQVDEPAAEPPSDNAGGGGDELKQPNKAASAEDWKAFAEQEGGFEAATGVAPADASRKAIVDHYTAQDSEE